MTNKILVVLVVLFLVIGGSWYLGSNTDTPEEQFIVDTISNDTKLAGSQAIASDHKMVLQNNASLAVDGDLTIDGVLACDGGSASIEVSGALQVNRRIECIRPDGSTDGVGIVLAVAGPITFSKDAEVSSNGSVQIVQSAALAKETQGEIDALFLEAGTNSGAGTRIGPFTEGAIQKISLNGQPVSIPEFSLIREAHAQDARDKDGNLLPQVILSGRWTIGNGGTAPSGVAVPVPPKDVKKILLNFDFGDKGNIEIKDFHLVGPDGRDGDDDIGKSCNARGGKGEDAFRMRVNAANITIDNFRLELGDGGKGGDAETTADCDSAHATGGVGGAAGNFKMTALGKIVINNFHVVPGMGGQGGSATAIGKPGIDACPGTKGGDAIATGGDGGKNKKELAALGAVEGIGSVTVDKVEGGEGGPAFAKPGRGGNGTGCKCAGGKGGSANATGGKGGDASLKLTGATGEAVGGDGGDANAHGADGGVGGNCPLKPTGGKGGNGGNAITKIGKAGKGTTGDGADGIVQDETGGVGGNGGDGCGPGGGGKGGLGKPNGADGKPGELQCPIDAKTPPPPMTDPGQPIRDIDPPAAGTTGGGATGATEKKKIKVIEYNGKYLPVDQLIIESEVGCGADHWHAAQGVVTATDGTRVPDPGPQCGYGKTADKPAMDKEF
ncbi:MAG: hypothetical protein AAB367_00365 [Patescibacteria group bacterium]